MPINWPRIILAVSLMVAPIVVFCGGYFYGYQERDERAQLELERERNDYRDRVSVLNKKISKINSAAALKLAQSKTKGSVTVQVVESKTHENPATPTLDCRIDDDAFRVLVDAFRRTSD